MSELKYYKLRHIVSALASPDFTTGVVFDNHDEVYYKSEADNVIAEKDAEIAELKNRIAPKQSDKTLQERLNEVCKKHGVSTLQDLDWAFCMAESRLEDYMKSAADKHKALEKMSQYKVLYNEKCRDINTQERFFAMKVAHEKYKRCLAMAKACDKYAFALELQGQGRSTELLKRHNRAIERKYKWLAIAEKFKPSSTAQ